MALGLLVVRIVAGAGMTTCSAAGRLGAWPAVC
jgi:hypothetical protein